MKKNIVIILTIVLTALILVCGVVVLFTTDENTDTTIKTSETVEDETITTTQNTTPSTDEVTENITSVLTTESTTNETRATTQQVTENTETPTEKPTEKTTQNKKPFQTEKVEDVRPKETEPPAVTTTNENTLNSSYSPNQIELEVLNLVNQRRAENGLPSLEFGYFYYDCARKRAKEGDGYFSHTRPNGTSWDTVFSEYHVDVSKRYVGENIAQFLPDATSVMEGWMNSSGHRANILSGDYDYVAIAMYESAKYPGHYTFVQLFASKNQY